MSTRYLVRFDDICPTMNWRTWEALEEVLVETDIKPILAVIPDNQDDSLKIDPPNESFWDRARVWRDRGWTIGVHGYQHTYLTEDPGIVGMINKYSEFAGLPRELQAAKLRMALEIFRREGIRPDVWVAPAHSFDHATVSVLRELGLRSISDGFFLYPNRDSIGMLWIPLQLWRFRAMPFGVWGVGLHINAWGPRDILHFQRDVKRYRRKIIGLEDAIACYGNRRRDFRDRLFQLAYPQYLRTLSKLSSWVKPHISPQGLAPDRPKLHVT